MNAVEEREVVASRALTAAAAFAVAVVLTGPGGALMGVPILGCLGLPIYGVGVLALIFAALIAGGGVSLARDVLGVVPMLVAAGLLVAASLASLDAVHAWLLARHRGTAGEWPELGGALAAAAGSSVLGTVGLAIRQRPWWGGLAALPLPWIAIAAVVLSLLILDALGMPLTA